MIETTLQGRARVGGDRAAAAGREPVKARAIGPAGDAATRIMERVSARVGPEGFGRYFAHQTRLSLDGGKLSVTVPTGFVAELIGKRFAGPLVEAAREELSREVELKISVDGGAFGGGGSAGPAGAAGAGTAASVVAKAPRPAARVVSREATLRYRLDDFVVGEANRLAFDGAQRLADPATPRTFSPLFIHGSCGLGKTHLLQGIAQRYREARPRAGVRYMTAEAFTNDYIGAVRSGRLEGFRKAYRQIELLCLDDVQFLSNKTATQGELLHTFDAIDLAGKVALASDEHPRQVRRFSEALVSRFVSGMVCRLDPPEPALREKIVLQLAGRRGMVLEPAAARLIASHYASREGSVRDLEGVLVRLDALTRLMPEGPGTTGGGGGVVGLVLVRKALGLEEGEAGRGRRPVRMESIIDEVCRSLGVQIGDFVGRGRHKRVVLARAVTTYLARGLTTLSYPEIARAMGRPNHSTVVTACQRITGQIERNETLPAGEWGEWGGPAGTTAVEMTVGALCEQVRRDILRLPAA